APSLRPKARYMNLAALLRWARKILILLDRGPGGGNASARAEFRYGWLREFRLRWNNGRDGKRRCVVAWSSCVLAAYHRVANWNIPRACWRCRPTNAMKS